MPKKGDGSSLKNYKATVWYGTQKGLTPGQTVELAEIKASNLHGAVGRAARVARAGLKGQRFDMATVNVEAL